MVASPHRARRGPPVRPAVGGAADGGLGGRSGVGPAGTLPCDAPGMRMRFGPGDEKGFEKGSRLLVEGFGRWLVERVGPSSGEAAEVGAAPPGALGVQ